MFLCISLAQSYPMMLRRSHVRPFFVIEILKLSVVTQAEIKLPVIRF